MRRVVITGIGIVSCIGNDLDDVSQSLREGRQGLRYAPEYAEVGLRSQVTGTPDLSGEPLIERKLRRFMGDAAEYAYHAMRRALSDASLGAPDIAGDPRTGLIVGSGVGSLYEHTHAIDTFRSRGIEKVPPYVVPRLMGSTTSGCLATAFGIHGTSYSITSACASSAHCIGHGAELIQHGKQDRVIVGGAEEARWTSAAHFDAMGALSTKFNDPSASRPFDAARDGFVLAGGAGILILEALDTALARGARIHGELIGYGASSDGADMVSPNPEGACRAMQVALRESGGGVDYLNAHATSTRLGDLSELEAAQAAFAGLGLTLPVISSTKGLTGHPIAAAGAHEAIYSLLMLKHDFLPACANIDVLDPSCAGYNLLLTTQHRRVNTIMSNSFGFGGTNASLIFRRYG